MDTVFIIRVVDCYNEAVTFSFNNETELTVGEQTLKTYFRMKWFSAEVNDASATKGRVIHKQDGEWGATYRVASHKGVSISLMPESRATKCESDNFYKVTKYCVAGNMWIVKKARW